MRALIRPPKERPARAGGGPASAWFVYVKLHSCQAKFGCANASETSDARSARSACATQGRVPAAPGQLGCRTGIRAQRNDAFAEPQDDRLGVIGAAHVATQMPGDIAGYVTADAAAATGIPEGVPVVTTANDKAVEALGSGSLDERTALISLGTYIRAGGNTAPPWAAVVVGSPTAALDVDIGVSIPLVLIIPAIVRVVPMIRPDFVATVVA